MAPEVLRNPISQMQEGPCVHPAALAAKRIVPYTDKVGLGPVAWVCGLILRLWGCVMWVLLCGCAVERCAVEWAAEQVVHVWMR